MVWCSYHWRLLPREFQKKFLDSCEGRVVRVAAYSDAVLAAQIYLAGLDDSAKCECGVNYNLCTCRSLTTTDSGIFDATLSH